MDADPRSRLACEIVLWHFGPVCHRVALALVGREPCSLRQLQQRLCSQDADASLAEHASHDGIALVRQLRGPERGVPESVPFTRDLVREALLSLVTHNIVFPIGEEGDSRRYSLVATFAVQRLQFPLFLDVVRIRLGEPAVDVLKEVMAQGRATAAVLLRDLTSPVHAEALSALVREQYVVPSIAAVEHLKEQLPKQRYEKQSKRGVQSNLSERFRHGADDAPKKGRRGKGDGVGDADAQQWTEHAHAAWTVNGARFSEDFVHKYAVSLVADKLDAAAHAVLQTALHMTRERGVRTLSRNGSALASLLGAELYEEELVTRVLQAQAHQPVGARVLADAQQVRDYLAVLSKERSPQFLVRHQGASEASYTVALGEIVRAHKQRALEALVLEQLGADALRVWRALCELRQLEAKQVADAALIPVEETRQHLYRLLEHGLVRIQEVPRAADHAPSRTYFLWTVPPLSELCLDRCNALYKTAYNLLARLGLELHRAPEKSRADELRLRMHAALIDVAELAALLGSSVDADDA